MCTTALHLLLILAHRFNVIIDRSVVAPGYVGEVVGGVNATDIRFNSMLMMTLQLTSFVAYDTNM